MTTIIYQKKPQPTWTKIDKDDEQTWPPVREYFIREVPRNWPATERLTNESMQRQFVDACHGLRWITLPPLPEE